MSNWAKKLPAVAIILAAIIAFSPVATAYALGAPAGAVNGYVKSAMNGAAMSNVKVRVFDMNTAEFVAEVTTNDDGALNLNELPLGLYQITVVAPEGYAAAAGPLVSLTEENPEATVAFNLETLPGAAPAQQFGGFPWWAFFAIGGGIAGITIAALALNNGTPDVPVGTG